MRSALRFGGLVLASAMAVVGCADDRTASETKSTYGAMTAPAAAMSPPAREEAAQDRAPADESKAPARAATAGRKIIYNASVDLVTEDLNKLEAALNRLVAAGQAYVADSDRSGSAGATRHGMWKVRVPVDGYDAFLKGAVALGELVSVRANSQDVSAEFYDLEARQTAKKIEEGRLLKHLSDSTGKLEEILAVERELARVRGEIEQMEGRLRVLANLTTLATVTVTASEIKGYVPPRAPTLATRVGRTFFDSLDTLRSFGEAVLLFAVALALWLPLILLAVLILIWITRRIVAAARRLLARPANGPR